MLICHEFRMNGAKKKNSETVMYRTAPSVATERGALDEGLCIFITSLYCILRKISII